MSRVSDCLFLESDGVELLDGGGKQITFPTDRWIGLGHNAVYHEDRTDYSVYHCCDAESLGAPTLRIAPLAWDEDIWPTLQHTE